jgi:hypothetical protein
MRHLPLLALLTMITACAGDDGTACVDPATSNASAAGETEAPFCAEIPDGEPAYVAGFALGLDGPYPPQINYSFCANVDDPSPTCMLWWDGVGDGIKARARCLER